MATPKFQDLALQYVLADESDQAQAIAEKAAAAIEEATNSRVTVGQWVASINQWIQPSDDENLISRAKALDFLASTLVVLNQRNVSLKNDQVKLLVTFFGSLFSSDHRAGVAASTKALRQLVGMKSFQPTLGDDIIANVCKLGDDFKLQTPATRLELYELFLGLILDPAVVKDLENRHGDTCAFMTNFLDLCRNERDPQNLLKWFTALKTFLQNFSPSENVTLDIFKAFSAYFPISLRASASPSGITADDLKGAVRSCFAAHYRLASHAIPYLINKLDQGDAVTVAVKVDILQTLNACLVQYEHPQQSVVPYVDQIWSSLKYEVRNGEISDIIKATLKVIASLTARLEVNELRSFIANAWRDLFEDISSPTYTAQAGRLLVAMAGASIQSFASITSQAVPHIQTTLKHAQSASHKQDLVALLNSILAIRSHLASTLKGDEIIDNSSSLLRDELFGDTLFYEVYAPLWEENSGDQVTTEQAGVLKKVMEGLATLVGQQSSGTGPHQLCSASTCEQIFGWLAGPAVIHPLEGRQVNSANSDSDADMGIRDAAVAALKEAVPLYPTAFQFLLQQFLSSLQVTYQRQLILHDFPSEIQLVASTLSEISCSNKAGTSPALLNHITLINTLLQGLLRMIWGQASPEIWTALVCSIHLVVVESMKSLSTQEFKSPGITKVWYMQFSHAIENAGAPRLDLNEPGNIDGIIKALQVRETEEGSSRRQLLAYSFSVVKQLYRRFTVVNSQTANDENRFQSRTELGKDFGRGKNTVPNEDYFLHQLASFATSVVRELSVDEQKALELGKHAFSLFHDSDAARTDHENESPVELSGVSRMDDFRTAPLTMGILQGLYPGLMSTQQHMNALRDLCNILTSTTATRTSPLIPTNMTRAALDNMLAILSNRLRVANQEEAEVKLQAQDDLMTALTNLFALTSESTESSTEIYTATSIFRSILHFLAGDVARFRAQPDEHNQLLKMVCDQVPSERTMGRQLARYFEVLVSSKGCLKKENHAIQKMLSGEWLYFRAVQPYFEECFPNSKVTESQATNRAVAIFAILKHLKGPQYFSGIEQIVRVGIRSLSTFEIGAEMESCLAVLLHILEEKPGVLQEHLAGLISGMIKVYETARKTPKATGATAGYESEGKARVLCRKYALEFFQKLPSSYETQYIVLHRKKLLRPLSAACGDPVRAIRRTALLARKAWDTLA